MEGKARFIFPVIISALIVFVVSGVVTFTNIGLRADFVPRWLKAFMTGWPVAAVLAFVAIPYVRRATEVIKRMRSLLKKAPFELKEFDLNEIVQNGLEMFTGRLDGIQLRADLAAGLPLVNLDPEQFRRVVVNLVDNAAEAMRDSMVKRLLVATRPTSHDTVELLVADTGCGVSADDKGKLFLPYFSTKGRGTGLGLAIVSHILSEHGGRIRVEDNRPAGTRFFVEVPVSALDTISTEAEVRA